MRKCIRPKIDRAADQMVPRRGVREIMERGRPRGEPIGNNDPSRAEVTTMSADAPLMRAGAARSAMDSGGTLAMGFRSSWAHLGFRTAGFD